MPSHPDQDLQELVEIQVDPGAVQPSVTETATDLVMPPRRISDRLRHFSENVYDLSPESHLSRFMKVLLGDAGVGRLRKRLLMQHMRATLQGSHFYDLDRFYGPLFGLRRSSDEILSINPYGGVATREEWDDVHARDASFRSRIEQFSRAIGYGTTPVGMELIAEALLTVDCEINEGFVDADRPFQTYQDLEDQYGLGTPGGTYTDMEGTDYATLEGYGLDVERNSGRRTFIVRPKRYITPFESYNLSRVLDKLKPSDTRFIIDQKGVPLHIPLIIRGAYADSTYWEINQKVGTSPDRPHLPYSSQSPTPVEQPRPPFGRYQGEAWSYIPDLAGISASTVSSSGDLGLALPQRQVYVDGTSFVFSIDQAILPSKVIQSGRSVSDSIMIGFPYDYKVGGTSSVRQFDPDKNATQKLYVDGIPLKELNDYLDTTRSADPFQQNPETRFWVSAPRPMTDTTEEIIEIRLNTLSWVNYITFEMTKFPHQVTCEVFDDEVGDWVAVFSHTIDFSVPKLLNPGEEIGIQSGHSQHSAPNHWEKISEKIDPKFTRRIRLKMQRVSGTPPYKTLHTFDRESRFYPDQEEVDYSLGIRSWDAGYRIRDRSDFDFIEDDVLGATIDYVGSRVQFETLEHLPSRAIDRDSTTAWRSEPQIVNYAVVNFYLDMRTEVGDDSQVVDRFFLDPTHAGANFSIYYSDDSGVPDGTNEWYDDLVWTPIPRNYVLQKGFVHIPPTKARHFKFEFSNLVAEQFESFIPILRVTKLFSKNLVRELGFDQGQAEEALGAGMSSAIGTATEVRYRDAIDALLVAQESEGPDPQTYRPTESLWIDHLEGAQRIQEEAWQFQFTPWHQEDGQYPKFNKVGLHTYEEVEVQHSSKVSFFVGLRTIKAYRTKYEEDENTSVYWDTFDDARNLDIGTGITWVIDDGHLHAEGTSPPVVAESRTFFSREPIKALQFATVQSEPVQLVPDHFFRSPSLGTYEWDDPDSFRQIGDATLVYDPTDFSVINFRYVKPIQKFLDRVGGLVQPIIQPVFGERPFEVRDAQAEAATFGGMKTSLVGLSEQGRAYAAVRFTMLTDQTEPLILRVRDNTDGDAILAELEITGRKGELVEEYIGFDIPDAVTVVFMELLQEGKTSDQWKVNAISCFDEAIFWEFSVNGGGAWYPALEVKNNENGIMTFPDLGTQLRFRVTGYRVNRWISAIKLRPHYIAYGNARPVGTHRGPNVSLYDHDIPIHDDPLFTNWTKPVPYWWFAESRRFPILSVEGAAAQTQFNKFYGRPVTENLGAVSDAATGLRTHVRSVIENLAQQHPVSDVATRALDIQRVVTEDLTGLTDSAVAYIIFGEGDPLNAPIPDDV